MNPKGLAILNQARILAISLPSHSSSVLQVHDVSIFKPLKTYFSNALTTHTRTNGPKLDIKELPKILEEPFHAANNPFYLRSGFKKVGLFPPNFQWLERNQDKLKILMIKRKGALFEDLCEKVAKEGRIDDHIQRLQFFNLMYLPLSSINKTNNAPQLKRSLSDLLTLTKEHLIRDKKIRKNFIGEDPSVAKILNETDG